MLAATRFWSSERLLQSRTAPSNVLRSSVSLQSRCKQCRNYSPVVPSSSSSQFRNGRRSESVRFQQRPLKRDLSWETKSKVALKKAARGSHRTVDPIKFASIGQVKTWASDFLGIRPGANIEDVERSAIDHLFRGDKKANILKATLTHAHHFSRPSPNTSTSKGTLFSAVHAQGDTYVDPITNRRVSKSSTAGTAALFEEKRDYEPTDFVDVSVKADSAPKYDDLDKYKPTKDIETEQPDQPKYDDLDKYEPVVDERPAQEQPVEYDDLDKYGPVKHNEPDGKRPTTTEEDSKQYKDLDKYASTGLDDPLAKREMTAEEQSKLYDDLDQYKPVYYNEPDGKRAQTTEELSKNYDDLEKYDAVYWNEPDGLRERTPEELSKDYKDLDSYGPVAFNEPDGLRRLTPEEESKKYDDLDSYANPFEASQSVLKAHEKAQMDATMRGKPLAPKVDAPVEDLTSKYNDLHMYGPVHWNEPDGLRELTPEELSKNYDDLHLYGAVRHNEPDGLRPLTAEEKSKHYKDTHLYAARDLSPPVERVHPEEASKVYKDLPGYRDFENADNTTPRIHPEETSKRYSDLGAYASFENDGPQTEVHPEEASKHYKDLHKYPSVGFEEAIRVKHVHPEELTKYYTDLGNYKPSGFVSQAQAYPVNPEEASKVYQDLHKYTTVGHNEPNNKMSVPLDEVARGLREFDSKAGPHDSPDTPSNTYGNASRSSPGFTETKVDHVDHESAEAIRAAVLRRVHEDSQRAKSQSAFGDKGHQAESQPSSSRPKLTGNYARDFPEEFVSSWSKDNSPSKSALCPSDYSGKSAPVKEVSSVIDDDLEPGSMDESFPIEDSKLQPALDRHTGRVYKDPYSHVPQGLQTSYSEECGRSTMPVMEKHHVQQESKAETMEMPNTVSYKILAFDPTSKMMSVAQATSLVGANDSPMAVPDALVKLAQPAKFLPYFKSLQNQGYEVVSASGHMLIFRQMGPTPETSAGADVNSFDEMVSRGGTFPASDDGVRAHTRRPRCKRPRPSKKRKIGRHLLIGTVGIVGSAYAAATLTKDLSTEVPDTKNQQTRRD